MLKLKNKYVSFNFLKLGNWFFFIFSLIVSILNFIVKWLEGLNK